MSNTFLLCVALALFTLGPMASANQQVDLPDSLRLSVVHSNTIKQMYYFELQAINEIFNGLGINLELIPLPPKRAFHSARSGATDGIAGAIYGLDESYPELSPIPTALVSDSVWVWVKKGTTCPKTIDELSDLTTVKVLGVILYDDTKEIQASPSHQTSSFPNALNMVQAGRADYLIFPERGLRQVSQAPGAFTRCLDQPITTLNLHTYLNKKYAALIPLLNQRYQQSAAHKKTQ